MHPIDAIRQQLKENMKDFDADVYTADDAAELVVWFSDIERCAAAGKLLAARRVEKSGLHEREGHKEAGSWLAGLTGESVGQATSRLDTARRAEAHPAVSNAIKSGAISEAQAKEIVTAADLSPSQASDLVAEAPWLDFSQLKKRCSDVRAAATSEEDLIARHERIRKTRFCRTWVDSEGAGHLQAQMTADALAIFRSVLGGYEKQVFDEARSSGLKEPHQAYSADALVAMALGSVAPDTDKAHLAHADPADGADVGAGADGADAGTGVGAGAGSTGKAGSLGQAVKGNAARGRAARGRDATGKGGSKRTSHRCPIALMRVIVSEEALIRGRANPGETCEILGCGPVPVSLARDLIDDAILELVVTRGVDVTTVVSDSRYVRKALRIALEHRDQTCVVPGCNNSDPLERDHWRVDYGKDGPTEIANLARLCPWHHHQKTYYGWKLEGGPGQWRFLKPPDPPPPGASESDSVPKEAVVVGARRARHQAARGNDPPVQSELL